MLAIFPCAGSFRELGHDPRYAKINDYGTSRLPMIASVHHVGFCHADAVLTKNSFLDEIGKQYVVTARAKGLTERQVLYGHVFRNAMLIDHPGVSRPLHRSVFRRLDHHRDDLFSSRGWAQRLQIGHRT